MIFGEEIPSITAKAGIKKVTGIDLKKSNVGSNIDQIHLFKLSKKLNKIPKIMETRELTNTSLAVDDIASNTELSVSDIKKSAYISMAFGNFNSAGLHSFNRLKSTAKKSGSISSPKKKILILDLEGFINFFIYF
jgi:hypothetical protein